MHSTHALTHIPTHFLHVCLTLYCEPIYPLSIILWANIRGNNSEYMYIHRHKCFSFSGKHLSALFLVFPHILTTAIFQALII